MRTDKHRSVPVTPLLTVDTVIVYNKKIVLIKRKNPPFQGHFALPGGFVEVGETVETAAVREAKEETGLDVTIANPEQPLCVHADPNRDPRVHAISVAFVARGSGVLRAGQFDDARNPRLYTLPEVRQLIELDKLAFDHGSILEKYLAIQEAAP